MLAWRSNAAGQTGDLFNWASKYEWLIMVLRDRWEWFDLAALGLCVFVMLWSVRRQGLTYSRNLAASVLFLVAGFRAAAAHRVRLGLCRHAARALSLRHRAGRHPLPGRGDSQLLSGARHRRLWPSCWSAPARTTISMWLYDRATTASSPRWTMSRAGARMVSFVGRPCVEQWAMTRLLHLPAMAIARRHAFSNDQWTMAGAQLLQVRYRPGLPFIRDSDRGGHPAALPRRGLAHARHLARHLPARRLRLCLADRRRRLMTRR